MAHLLHFTCYNVSGTIAIGFVTALYHHQQSAGYHMDMHDYPQISTLVKVIQ